MLDSISDFFGGILLKFVPHMPTSNFSYDSYLASLHDVLAHVNYFIPFYIFAPITIVWISVLTVTFGILVFLRWFKGSV